MTTRAIVLCLLGAACSEQEFHVENLPGPKGDLRIRGRVCDPVTRTWLPNALVYTHLYDEHDVVYDSRSAYSAADGSWELGELVADKDYEIYVQVGHDVVDAFVVALEDEDAVVPEAACTGSVDLGVAVISGAWDDLQPLLEAIGVSGARVIDGQAGTEIVDFLTDPAAMAEYDVIFFDGGHREEGVVYGDGPIDAVHASLRSYVADGGTVFVSDWAYDVVEQVWPDALDFVGDDTVPDAAQIGDIALVDADVVDPGLAGAVRLDRIPVTYDLPVWPVIEATSPSVSTYVAGDAPWRIGLESGIRQASPLLVGFEEGRGRVLFSTWRTRANDDPAMRAVLVNVMEGLIDPETP